jgi:HTH-type transcriptional repressor of NAD biosynthesis genes
MPPELRLSWLGYICKSIPNVEVHSIEDAYYNYDFIKMVPQHRKLMPHIDKVFTSEPIYDFAIRQCYPEAEHVILDAARSAVKCSATAIRKDPFANWQYLDNIVRAFFSKKILITGIESTGKSTMVKLLADHFGGEQVQEVGRDYCLKYGNKLTLELFYMIAMEHHLKQVEAAERGSKYVFVDTDAVVTNYYRKAYLDGRRLTTFCKEIIERERYDKILYLEPTVPWVEDGLRFLSANRDIENKKLLKMYKGMDLVHITESDFADRFQSAIKVCS